MTTRAVLLNALTAALTAALSTACTHDDEDWQTAKGDVSNAEDTDGGRLEAEDRAEAPSDRDCRDTPCTDDEICDGFTGACRPALDAGEACLASVLSPNECRQDLVCHSLSKTCSAPSGLGEACGIGTDCGLYAEGGLTCDRTAGRCVLWGALPEGSACAFSEECSPGLFCGPHPVHGGPPAPGDDILTAGSRCRPPGARGETCYFDGPDLPPTCQPGLACTLPAGAAYETCEPRFE